MSSPLRPHVGIYPLKMLLSGFVVVPLSHRKLVHLTYVGVEPYQMLWKNPELPCQFGCVDLCVSRSCMVIINCETQDCLDLNPCWSFESMFCLPRWCLMWVQQFYSTHMSRRLAYTFQAGYGLLFYRLGTRWLRSILMTIHLFSEID